MILIWIIRIFWAFPFAYAVVTSRRVRRFFKDWGYVDKTVEEIVAEFEGPKKTDASISGSEKLDPVVVDAVERIAQCKLQAYARCLSSDAAERFRGISGAPQEDERVERQIYTALLGSTDRM